MLRTLLFVSIVLIDLHSDCVALGEGPKTEHVIDTQAWTEGLPSSTTADDYALNLRLIPYEKTDSTTKSNYYEDLFTDSVKCDITNFRYDRYTNSIRVIWKDCGANYNVELKKTIYDGPEIPQFRRLNASSSYTFEKLEQCTAYNLSIAPDNGERFETTIRTLPGRIENLKASIEHNVTTVTWNPSSYQDCGNYQLLVNNETMPKTRSNSLKVAYDLTRCTRIGVAAMDTKDAVGEVNIRAVPGVVQNVVTNFNANSISATWDPPEDASCVVGYLVRLNNGTPVVTANAEHTFTNIEACTVYTVGIAVYSDTEDTSSYVDVTDTTDTPNSISAVQNMNLQTLEDALRVTWNPPALQGACITSYGIIMWAVGIPTQDYTVTTTTFDFTPVVPCMLYNVMVKAMIQTAEGVSTIRETAIADRATNPPTLVSATPAKTSSTIVLKMDAYAVNMCTITVVQVNCTAEGNEDHEWIVDGQYVDQPHTDSTNRQVTVVVDGLSEYTNYTCYAYVQNSGGTSNASEAIVFRTLQEVPTSPRNLQYSEDAEGVLITWEVPYKVPGVQGNYSIIAESVGALHSIPEECDVTPEDVQGETVELQFRISDVLANFQYNVSVAASTSAGFGEAATILMRTNPGISEACRNVTYAVNNVPGAVYNASLFVSWLQPCNTNGQLTYFKWSLEGESLSDDGTVTEDGTVKPIGEGAPYELYIPSLRAFYNYTFSIAVYVDGNENGGEETVITFISPEGLPTAPLHLTYSEDVEGVLITWELPAQINGVPETYVVLIESVGPLHYIPEECSITPENVEGRTDELEFRLIDFLANFQYNVSVVASTSAGFGEAANMLMTTNPGTPEACRDVTYEVENFLGETYNASLIVSWLSPCNTNGKLQYFMWTLVGESLDTYALDTQEGHVLPINEDVYYEIHIPSLLSYHNYTFSIAAYVEDNEREGQEVEITFLSPDGYSSPPQDFLVDTIKPTSAWTSWSEPLEKNGVLISYRVNVTPTGPLHYIPNDCELTYEPHSVVLSPTKYAYLLELLPSFQYKVAIAAENSIGYGLETAIDFVTPKGVSTPPRNVSILINNYLGYGGYNASVTFDWLTPCNTNGLLLGFEWRLFAKPLEDEELEYADTDIVLANANPNNTFYTLTITDLRPLYNYTLSIAAVLGNATFGEADVTIFFSPDGYPSAPADVWVDNITSSDAIIYWDEPRNVNGLLENYKVVVTVEGPLYKIPDGCVLEYDAVIYNVTVDPTMLSFEMQGYPNFRYAVNVSASTREDYGPEMWRSFSTLVAEPDIIQNFHAEIYEIKTENYQSYAIVSFEGPCELHDNFSHYDIDIFGQRVGFDTDNHAFQLDNFNNNSFRLDLRPQFEYYGRIDVFTVSNNSTITIDSFTAPTGVPSRSTAVLRGPEKITTTTASFTFDDEIFDRSQGDIAYYALILNVGDDISGEIGGNFNFWNLTWPDSGYWSDSASEYQATPSYWKPFEFTRDASTTYIIGEANCTTNNTYCNGPLRPDTRYALRIRGFTQTGYRDTNLIFFTTLSDQNYLSLILGLVFGILAAIIILIFIFILYRRRKKEKVTDTHDTIAAVVPTVPPAIPKKKFVEHCGMFEENRSELKAEYTHLDRLSASAKPSSQVAMSDNNKRKNRYINIMPYDDTRVKLATDTNDNYEDYINASYIRGYSGNSEYIATQGPLESTVDDFWRMIVQEDVGIIVMVAQFVEQTKQKCYKYFPEKEETITVGRDINIKCTNEVNLTDYITRTLIVEKDGEQKAIKHLQFMLWPDFGCPTNTRSMLEFREVMRRHIEMTKDKAVIHCSAGVGRTGTLIAIDILLQKIDNSEEAIDVFGTVLDLRKQRTHMVQTEKQYEYIHKCLRDYLVNPKQTTDA